MLYLLFFKDISKLSQMLEKIMQDLFLNYFSVNESQHGVLTLKSPSAADSKQQLRHVLKSYSLLAKQRQAEQLFTDYKVKPFMEEVRCICLN